MENSGFAAATLLRHISMFRGYQQHRYKVYSSGQIVPSTPQIRAEGNTTKCVGQKRFNGSVTHGLRKEHVLRLPFLDKARSYFVYGYL
jgi:hypothetical protein